MTTYLENMEYKHRIADHLRVFADALDGEVYHYRDKNGLECDAVVHLRNGKYGNADANLQPRVYMPPVHRGI